MNHLFDAIRACMPAETARFLETEGGAILTYGELVRRSGALARRLVQIGVEPGARVAVQVDKSHEALLLYLACVRAGAVLLPLNTAYTQAELGYFFGDAEPALIVCRPEAEREISGLAGSARVVTLGADGRGSLLETLDSDAAFADVARGPGDLAAILYTSGTTGRSKGAMLTHDNLASNAKALADLWRFTRSDVLIHALPIFHTHGLFTAINTILFAGASMLFFERFDARAVIAAMPRATSMMGVPTFYTRLLDHPALSPEATKTIRLFISGSAPLLSDTFEAWRRKTGHAILERYGMTETSMNTSNPYEGERLAGTVGRPLPGIEIRITEPESGAPLALGEIGMVEVRGPNVFKGYWRMPEKTASEFRPDGFFITGDLGRIEDHGYLQIVGRGKDLVISGGFNVYPKEVETEIDAIAGVVESAVIGLPHPDFGEGVTAVVVRTKGAALTEADLLAALGSRLARYKRPQKIYFVDELPRNTMGKVQKAVLRERFRNAYV